MYHIVKCSYKGQYRTYEIYKDNVPFIIPAKGMKISRRQAKRIVEKLND